MGQQLGKEIGQHRKKDDHKDHIHNRRYNSVDKADDAENSAGLHLAGQRTTRIPVQPVGCTAADQRCWLIQLHFSGDTPPLRLS